MAKESGKEKKGHQARTRSIKFVARQTVDMKHVLGAPNAHAPPAYALPTHQFVS